MSYKKMLPLVLAALLLWTVPASAAPETTLKVALGDPEDSEMGVVGHAFKKYVEEKTGGKVEVQCFYGGSLGDESECFRNVQKGTLPLALGGIANLVPFEKKLGLLTLPYLFANIDEVVAGTNGAPAELLNKYATKAGFRVLTWTYTDFRYISNSAVPVPVCGGSVRRDVRVRLGPGHHRRHARPLPRLYQQRVRHPRPAVHVFPARRRKALPAPPGKVRSDHPRVHRREDASGRGGHRAHFPADQPWCGHRAAGHRHPCLTAAGKVRQVSSHG